MISKFDLEKLVQLYEVKEFIKDDPIQFPHRYNDKRDIEISGFLASVFAYGKRSLFICVLNELFEQMENSPFNFICSEDKIKKIHNIDYRFSKNIDIVQILLILNKLYTKENSSLENLFQYGWEKSHDIPKMQKIVTDYFYANVTREVTKGFYHLLPDPSNKSPMKRMNMYLRWMTRGGEVDLKVWNFIPTSELIIPLDTHSARISRMLNLLKRTSNDIQAAKELTEKLKEYDKHDPIKFDFALFGYGVNNSTHLGAITNKTETVQDNLLMNQT